MFFRSFTVRCFKVSHKVVTHQLYCIMERLSNHRAERKKRKQKQFYQTLTLKLRWKEEKKEEKMKISKRGTYLKITLYHNHKHIHTYFHPSIHPTEIDILTRTLRTKFHLKRKSIEANVLKTQMKYMAHGTWHIQGHTPRYIKFLVKYMYKSSRNGNDIEGRRMMYQK